MAVDLDELEAKALAAQTICWFEPEVESWPFPFAPEPQDAAFIAACDPDTILHLIERARAGEELREYAGHARGCVLWDPLGTPNDKCDCGFAALDARWESLAPHSPQEAG